MNNDNKNRIIEGAKKVALVAYALLTIAVCAGVWNFCPEKAVCWGAGLLLACNGLAIYSMWKKATPNKSND